MEAYYIYLAMKIGNMKMKSMDTTGNILIFKEPASCNAWWWHWFDARGTVTASVLTTAL